METVVFTGLERFLNRHGSMYEYLPLKELFGMNTFSISAIAADTKQYQ